MNLLRERYEYFLVSKMDNSVTIKGNRMQNMLQRQLATAFTMQGKIDCKDVSICIYSISQS